MSLSGNRRIIDLWDAVGTTFTTLKVKVTNTASAAASKFLDFRLDDVSMFSVRKDGALTHGSTDAAVMKGHYHSGTIAVTVPAIADDVPENVDSVAVSTAAMTFACAVGDAVIAIPLAALPTDCLLLGSYVTATDEVTVVFGSKEGGAGVTSAAVNFKFLFTDLT